jgi:hypothetical protein
MTILADKIGADLLCPGLKSDSDRKRVIVPESLGHSKRVDLKCTSWRGNFGRGSI